MANGGNKVKPKNSMILSLIRSKSQTFLGNLLSSTTSSLKGEVSTKIIQLNSAFQELLS